MSSGVAEPAPTDSDDEEEEPSDVAKALWASERGCVQDDYGTDDDEHEDPYAGIPFRA
eukprot:COSAG01_NODE_61656_length_288_cov_1.100529_1_plen_57_part_01